MMSTVHITRLLIMLRLTTNTTHTDTTLYLNIQVITDLHTLVTMATDTDTTDLGTLVITGMDIIDLNTPATMGLDIVVTMAEVDMVTAVVMDIRGKQNSLLG
jgi:hypothetical protein